MTRNQLAADILCSLLRGVAAFQHYSPDNIAKAPTLAVMLADRLFEELAKDAPGKEAWNEKRRNK